MGTDLGTSRDSPALGGVYKLVADMPDLGQWRPVVKRSPAKATIPGAKQVFRTYRHGEMAGDLVASADEVADGDPLLVPVMRAGKRVGAESLDDLSMRAAAELESLPPRLRLPPPMKATDVRDPWPRPRRTRSCPAGPEWTRA